MTHSCGTVIACPSVAHLVRCAARGPGITTDTGCGEVTTGPALDPPDVLISP